VRHLKRTYFLINNQKYESFKNTTTKSKRALRSRIYQAYVRIYNRMRCIFNHRNIAKHMRPYLQFLFELTFFFVISVPLAITLYLTATLLSKIKNL
jgi:hypothetical protein